MQQVWDQEAEIREDTVIWLFSYLTLAYQPLSDEELQLYIDFSSSQYGQALNRALFAGFDRMFAEISRALGFAAGQLSGAQEL